MSFELVRFSNDEELAKGAAADWLKALRNRPSPQLNYTMALSGGRIARTFFKEIVMQAMQGAQDAGTKRLLQNVHFFWGDERCVPPGDPESNFGAASELLLKPLGVPEAQIHRVRGEGAEEFALREAVNDICRIAPVVNGQPVLDLVILGMGEDGHVASLFPGEPEEVRSSGVVYRAVTAVKPPPRRITLGYAALAAAREAWVIAAGAGKEGALKESLSPRGKTPLARAGAKARKPRFSPTFPVKNRFESRNPMSRKAAAPGPNIVSDFYERIDRGGYLLIWMSLFV